MNFKLPLWLMSLFAAFGLSAQHSCLDHQGHICSLEGVFENRFTYIAPPAGFVQGADRDVTITINYTGFTVQAQNAFQYAVDIWASLLDSNVPIVINATWENIPGNTLGYAGAQYYYPNVPGAGNNYYHPAALANKIAGSDLLPGQVDIAATFDSGTSWYFGTDGNCPANQFDFVSVVLHELGHGIGMVGSTAVNAGLGSFAFHPNFDIYDSFVENNPGTDIITYSNNSASLATQLQGNNLFWNGAFALENNNGTRPKLHVPNPWSQGSSYAHLDESLYPAGNVNSLMTPQIGFAEAIHDPGPIVLGMMEDIGWNINQGGGGGDCVNYNFYLETDCWGEETSFYIINDFGAIVYNINPNTLADLTAYSVDVCLEPGCYTLVIEDSFGDGMAGSQYPECLIDGFYQLTDENGGNVAIMVVANFGDIISYDFCVDGPNPSTICDCAGTVHTDGVLVWLGDGFVDDGGFTWEGQFVDFNCSTWGYDCGDIPGAPVNDPYGVCFGNLPPQGGCIDQNCGPFALEIIQAPCADNGNGLLPVFELVFTTGGCIVEEVCLLVNGEETCYYFPDFGIFPGDGESVFFIDTEPGATYVIEFTTDNGDLAGPYLWLNGTCNNEETICDCNGTELSIGVLSWLGDGFEDFNDFEWEGQLVNFNCATWGYDCGDIVAAPNQDPFGVCLGNLPPNNGCEAQICAPLAMEFEQVPCIDSGDGLLPAINITFATGGCLVEDLCFIVNGEETCFNLPANDIVIGNGEILLFFNTQPNTQYTFYFTTDNGDVSGSYIWNNGNCNNEETICDCNGTELSIGVLSWLGDGFEDFNDFEWEGQLVNFNCATWGYDCGDIVAAPNQDPYGVCEGNLPPNNGCEVSVCDPMAMSFNPLPCVDNGNGLLPSLEITFSIGGGCIAQELCLFVNGEETCFFLPDYELFPGNGESIILIDTEPDAVYSFFFTTDQGEVSDLQFFTNGNCNNEELVCDCDGLQHTIGVTSWLGDGFADDGTYFWNGQPVNFDCSTWGFDCGDIENAPVLDPYGVCMGNLPPQNGCADGDCDPLSMDLEQIPCIDAGDGLFPSINVIFNIGGDCLVDQLCFIENGNETCFDLQEFELFLGDGDALNIVNTNPNGIYTFYFSTDDGSVSPTFYWENGNCNNEVIICDCAGNQLTSGVLDWLGDGFADQATYLWDGTLVDFDCATWGYDCGDIVGAPNQDPFGVCDGNLPPNNGCVGEILGCIDPSALNYNPAATINDGSCLYELVEGCTDPEACNFDPEAQIDDESCYYGCFGCTDDEACNYSQIATIDDGSCNFDCYGCTDPLAVNYDPFATIDDGSCSLVEIEGCTDEEALNYNEDATFDDGSCIYDCEYPLITFVTFCEPGENDAFYVEMTIIDLGNGAPYIVSNNVNGDELFVNFTGTLQIGPFDNNTNVLFTVDSEDVDECLITSQLLNDDCSSQLVEGCTDILATNYDVFATEDDGSCNYDFEICDCDLETWSPAERFRLGDGAADDGAPGPNFNCETWGYDCGDILGAPVEDPYMVCDGMIPPMDGCIDSINEQVQSNWLVYPNPAEGMFFIEHQSANGKVLLSVYDATGRIIHEEEVYLFGNGRMSLDLEQAAAGTYFLNIVTEDSRTGFPLIIQK